MDKEVEVTPEMVQAGLLELSNFNSDMDSGMEFVTRLFLSMHSIHAQHIHQANPSVLQSTP